MTESSADLVCGDYTCVYSFFYKRFHKQWGDTAFDISDKVKLAQFLSKYFFAPWAKLYKKEILIKNKILFETWMTVDEDTNFILRYIAKCKRVATVSSDVYFWSRLSMTSLSRIYHEDMNKIYSLNMALYIAFFDRDELPISEQVNLIIIFLYYTVWSYVKFIDTRKLAAQKIEETYELFRGMLTCLHKEQLLQMEKEGDIIRFYRYLPLFEEGKYEEIYERIKEEIMRERTSKIGLQKRIAETLSPLSRFIVYRLNCFFHK